MDSRRRLLEFLREISFTRGRVRLSSGKMSDYYLDVRKTSLDPEGINLIGEVLWEELSPLPIDAVGGPESGAIPLVTIVAALSQGRGKPLRAFFVRKEAKSHGMMRRIEGRLNPGDKVAIIEDVVTTGATTLSAIKAVEEEGCQVVKIITLVDRREGGGEFLKEHGYHLDHIFSRDDFLRE